ncbi:hypothetical protein E2C01_021389 [Portunus trituberculatus]|uniref:Uncharacterized protein n=1 Tax=Portunus trituberculatus TaxID=210409 RepID=A0A5B7E5Y3_PORTR|nr:hypothetical protein [Portunus trituberculatus]
MLRVSRELGILKHQGLNHMAHKLPKIPETEQRPTDTNANMRRLLKIKLHDYDSYTLPTKANQENADRDKPSIISQALTAYFLMGKFHLLLDSLADIICISRRFKTWLMFCRNEDSTFANIISMLLSTLGGCSAGHLGYPQARQLLLELLQLLEELIFLLVTKVAALDLDLPKEDW